MGNLHKHEAERSREPVPVDPSVDEDEVGDEPWPLVLARSERRLPARAYKVWTDWRGERHYPTIAMFDPTTLAECEPYGLLLDLRPEGRAPAILHIGAKLAQECGLSSINLKLNDAPPLSLLSRILLHCDQIITDGEPVRFEDEFVNWRDVTVLYRGILLPFSSDDQKVDHVFCVINWKELADSQTALQLQFEIETAFSPSNI